MSNTNIITAPSGPNSAFVDEHEASVNDFRSAQGSVPTLSVETGGNKRTFKQDRRGNQRIVVRRKRAISVSTELGQMRSRGKDAGTSRSPKFV